MHTGPMKDSEGTFSAEADACTSYCKKCDRRSAHKAESWESSCGGYTDYRYTCMACGAVHWVDGCDS